MSDEECEFESSAVGALTTFYTQQADTIRENDYILIKGLPCKVFKVVISKTENTCHFYAKHIFTSTIIQDIVPSSHICDVPYVKTTDYQLIEITQDGFVSLFTENGNTKDDLKLPTNGDLSKKLMAGFEEGKDMVVTVVTTMGEEQICAVAPK